MKTEDIVAISGHIPTKSQVKIVVDTLKKSMKIVGSGLDMKQGDVDKCETLFCHGGHYLIGKHGIEDEYENYLKGFMLMAGDLGFHTANNMERFFIKNPEIWGNENAEFMGNSAIAFISTTRPYGAKNLNDIINHWEDVMERLPE
jgi:hypothetical protein